MIQPLAYPEAARRVALDYDGPRWTAPHEVQALCLLARQTVGEKLCRKGCWDKRLITA